MTYLKRMLRGIALFGVLAALGGIILLGGSSAAQTKGADQQYMAPRFPSYVKQARSAADLMPQARALVRNRAGLQGLGLGVVKSGETVALVIPVDAEEIAVKAVQEALGERGVKAILLPDYELVGISRKDALAFDETWLKARGTPTAEKGYMEASGWIRNAFPDQEKVMKWIKDRRPDL